MPDRDAVLALGPLYDVLPEPIRALFRVRGDDDQVRPELAHRIVDRVQWPMVPEVTVDTQSFGAKDREDAVETVSRRGHHSVGGPHCPVASEQRLRGHADKVFRLTFVLQPTQLGEQLVCPDGLIRDNKDARGSGGRGSAFRLRNARAGLKGPREGGGQRGALKAAVDRIGGEHDREGEQAEETAATAYPLADPLR